MSRRHAIPLARQLRRQLIVIGSVLSLGCLLLILTLVTSLSENINQQWMQLEAQALAIRAVEQPDQPLPQGESLKAWRSWSEIPTHIRNAFDDSLLVDGRLRQAEIESANGEPIYLEMLYHQPEGLPAIYLVSVYRGAVVEDTFTNIISHALQQTLLTTLLILLCLFLVIAWLLRRTMAPLRLLSQWAEQLNQQPEQAIDINFPITELNEIADQLRDGVDQVRASNQREQQFLKHASHELRTPLAVVQASLDTLQFQTSDDSPAQRSISRALKASGRMMQLSEALLWLARESDKTIPRSALALPPLCEQLVDDHRYLLRGRAIHIQQQVAPLTLEIEAPLLTIVLANLIRNACQHSGVTDQGVGEILIQLDGQQLQITNPVDPQMRSGDQSFGLGLELVERICHKLGWTFRFQLSEHQAQVLVTFQAPALKP